MLVDRAQLANAPPTRRRGVDDAGQAFLGVVVDDVEHTDPTAAGQRVRHEVERPALIDARTNERPLAQFTLALRIIDGIDRAEKVAGFAMTFREPLVAGS